MRIGRYAPAMCDVRVSTYPGINVFHCVSAYPVHNIVRSLPGEWWYFPLRIRVSSLFRGAASKWYSAVKPIDGTSKESNKSFNVTSRGSIERSEFCNSLTAASKRTWKEVMSIKQSNNEPKNDEKIT